MQLQLSLAPAGNAAVRAAVETGVHGLRGASGPSTDRLPDE